MRFLILLVAIFSMSCTLATSGTGDARTTHAALFVDPSTVTQWEVDYPNGSGCASDGNTCTSQTCDGMGGGPWTSEH